MLNILDTEAKRFIAITTLGVVLILLLVVGTSTRATATEPNPNDPATYGDNCYKHEGSNAHGYIVGKNVVLNPFDQSWPGDHWSLLVVKGGDDRTIINNPVAGVHYQAPLNNGGQTPDVSHWIVCKGTTPDPEPTVTEGEYTDAVGECVGDEFVTTTTVTPWVETDGVRVEGQPVVTITSEYDPSCNPLECPEHTVPGWLDESGNAQGCVNNEPNPGAPEPTTEPVVTPTPEPEPQKPAPATKPVPAPATPVVAEPTFTG